MLPERYKNEDSRYRELMEHIQRLDAEEALIYQAAMQHNNEVSWLKAAELEIVQAMVDFLTEVDQQTWNKFSRQFSPDVSTPKAITTPSSDNANIERPFTSLGTQLLRKLNNLVEELAEGRKEYIAYKENMVIDGAVMKLSPEQCTDLLSKFKRHLMKLSHQYIVLFQHHVQANYALTDILSELKETVSALTNTCEELQDKIYKINEAAQARSMHFKKEYSAAAQARSHLAKIGEEYDLLNACKQGDLNAVHQALDKESWLVRQFQSNREKLVNQLHDDMEQVEKSQETLLHVACSAGHIGMVTYLLSIGANPRLPNDRGYLPLHYAARNGHPVVVDILLQKAPDTVDALGEYKRTPLDEAVFNGNVDSVRRLLQYGVDLELTTSEDKQTPLIKAIRKGFLQIVILLIDAGARTDVEVQMEVDRERYKAVNLLHLSTLLNQIEIARYFLAQGIFVDLVTPDFAQEMLSLATKIKSAAMAKLWGGELYRMKRANEERKFDQLLEKKKKQLAEQLKTNVESTVKKFREEHTEQATNDMYSELSQFADTLHASSQQTLEAYSGLIHGKIIEAIHSEQQDPTTPFWTTKEHQVEEMESSQLTSDILLDESSDIASASIYT